MRSEESAEGAVRRLRHLSRSEYQGLVRFARTEFARAVDRGAVEPEDIVHQALLGVITGKIRCHSPDRIATFLRGVILNDIRNLRRWRLRRGFVEGGDTLPSTVPSPVDALIRQEELSRALKLVGSVLPTRQLQVFMMASWDGLDIRSIGSLLGISPETVKSHLRSARKTLRQVG
jgi:RNA polymerase sigma factor (sigma-70 family)